MTEQAQMQSLLQEVEKNHEKYEKVRQRTGCCFNIFSILRMDEKEVKICRFINEMLSPNGDHCQGSVYLNLFAKDVLSVVDNLENEFSGDNWDGAVVNTEEPTSEGRRMDIVIRTDKHYIVIEAKIKAGDQPNQLHDYYEFAQKQGKTALIYYLTKDGKIPENVSTGDIDKSRIHCISFERHITKWIEDCLLIPQTTRISPIREVLRQFLETLKRNSKQLREDEKMEHNDIIELLSKGNNLEFAREIYNALWEEEKKDNKDNKYFKQLNGVVNEIKDQLEKQFGRGTVTVRQSTDKTDCVVKLDYKYKEIAKDNGNSLYLSVKMLCGAKVCITQAPEENRVVFGYGIIDNKKNEYSLISDSKNGKGAVPKFGNEDELRGKILNTISPQEIQQAGKSIFIYEEQNPVITGKLPPLNFQSKEFYENPKDANRKEFIKECVNKIKTIKERLDKIQANQKSTVSSTSV